MTNEDIEQFLQGFKSSKKDSTLQGMKTEIDQYFKAEEIKINKDYAENEDFKEKYAEIKEKEV